MLFRSAPAIPNTFNTRKDSQLRKDETYNQNCMFTENAGKPGQSRPVWLRSCVPGQNYENTPVLHPK